VLQFSWLISSVCYPVYALVYLMAMFRSSCCVRFISYAPLLSRVPYYKLKGTRSFLFCDYFYDSLVLLISSIYFLIFFCNEGIFNFN
jgi:hypothetical protein